MIENDQNLIAQCDIENDQNLVAQCDIETRVETRMGRR